MGSDSEDAVASLPAEVRQAVEAGERLEALARLETFQPGEDPDFDRIVRLAARALDAPVALVSLVQRDRQWFKARIGIDARETPVSQSFCAHAIAAPRPDVMVIEDATLDPRFRDNPLVAGPPGIRFYAGAPIMVGPAALGTLCVIDDKPRPAPAPEVLADLSALAALAASLFELKHGSRQGALTRVALVREEKRRALAMEASRIASWAWDLRTGLLDCDATLPPMFGLLSTRRLRAADILHAIDARDLPAIKKRLRDALMSGEDYEGQFRIRGVEPARWLAGRGRVVERDEAGKPILVFGVNFDVSEQKLGEERQRILLRELNHRVKNTLAGVQALASQTVRHARSPQEFAAAFGGRLQALGAAHNLLSDRDWKGIDLDDLVRRQLAPFAARDRVEIRGAAVHVTPDQAVALGLVLHELVANAAGHGALSSPTGTVALSWSVRGAGTDRRLTLEWRESGGPRVEPPSHQGFGNILIRRSLDKLIGSAVRHDFLPEGVYAQMSFPLAEAA